MRLVENGTDGPYRVLYDAVELRQVRLLVHATGPTSWEALTKGLPVHSSDPSRGVANIGYARGTDGWHWVTYTGPAAYIDIIEARHSEARHSEAAAFAGTR